MLRTRSTEKRRIPSIPGQILAWLALSLLLLQMWGGPATFISLLAKDDLFAVLALKYLCSGDNAGEAASRANTGQPLPGDASLAGHHHCVLCQGGVSPLLPPLLGAVFFILSAIALPRLRRWGLPARQVLRFLRHSRAPPLAA
jgi:hypothetical protein